MRQNYCSWRICATYFSIFINEPFRRNFFFFFFFIQLPDMRCDVWSVSPMMHRRFCNDTECFECLEFIHLFETHEWFKVFFYFIPNFYFFCFIFFKSPCSALHICCCNYVWRFRESKTPRERERERLLWLLNEYAKKKKKNKIKSS